MKPSFLGHERVDNTDKETKKQTANGQGEAARRIFGVGRKVPEHGNVIGSV